VIIVITSRYPSDQTEAKQVALGGQDGVVYLLCLYRLEIKPYIRFGIPVTHLSSIFMHPTSTRNHNINVSGSEKDEKDEKTRSRDTADLLICAGQGSEWGVYLGKEVNIYILDSNYYVI